jgi:hypothetical protein
MDPKTFWEGSLSPYEPMAVRRARFDGTVKSTRRSGRKTPETTSVESEKSMTHSYCSGEPASTSNKKQCCHCRDLR